MKLLRTIRLDASDTFIFPTVAEPGEWAISGTFVFSDVDLAALQGKELSAFRIAVPSLGWSTLAQIVEADRKDRGAAIELTAQCLLDRFGAPDLAAAREAAEEEIDFTASRCDHPPNRLIAVGRANDGGTIHEACRSLRPRGGTKRWRAFSFRNVEVENESTETAPARGERE